MQSKDKDKKKNKNAEPKFMVFGWILTIVAAFLFLCLAIPPLLGPVSRAIAGFMWGVLGFSFYPLAILAITSGVFIIRGNRPRISRFYAICIAVVFLMVIFTIHLATTFNSIGLPFGAYIDRVFFVTGSTITGGGVLFGTIVFGLAALITPIVSFIIYGLTIILLTFFMLNKRFGFIKGMRARKREKIAAKNSPLQAEEEDDYYVREPRQIMPLRDKSLYVQEIIPLMGEQEEETKAEREDDIIVSGGSFSTLASSPFGSAKQEYSVAKETVQKPQKVETPPYLGTDTEEILASSSSIIPNIREMSKEDAHDILFGANRKYNSFSGEGSISAPSSAGRAEVASQTLPVQRPRKVVHERNLEEFGLTQPVKIPPATRFLETQEQKEVVIINGDAESVKLQEKEAKRMQESLKYSTPPPQPPPVVSTREPYFNASALGTSVPPPQPPAASIFRPFAPRATQDHQPTVPSTEYTGYNTKKIRPVIFPKIDEEAEREEEPYSHQAEEESESLEDFTSRLKGIINADEGIASEEYSTAGEESNEDTEKFSTASENEEFTKTTTTSFTETVSYSEEAIDLSEKKVFDGPDFTGHYVPTAPEKSIKAARRAATLEGQVPIDQYMSERAREIEIAPKKKKKKNRPYNAPPIDLLDRGMELLFSDDGKEESVRGAQLLEASLSELKLPVKVTGIVRGSTVTRYELEMPPGISVDRMNKYENDIKYNLQAKNVRVESPIPGKRAIGVEVPNKIRTPIFIRSLLESPKFTNAKSPLTIAVGKDVDNNGVLCDIAESPHILIAGATGSGKSVFLKSIIINLLYRCGPDDLRFILIDPKGTELNMFNEMPHLLNGDVIKEHKVAAKTFKFLVDEMERRYVLLARYRATNIGEYNLIEEKEGEDDEKLPFIVAIVDELANLMYSSSKKEIEEYLLVLAAKARASGIHLILATQRPSTDVVKGSLKVNLPTRIAFSLVSYQDSMTILSMPGAEGLIGKGDMLYSPLEAAPVRTQGAIVSKDEIDAVVAYIKENNEPDFDEDFIQSINKVEDAPSNGNGKAAKVVDLGGGITEEDALEMQILDAIMEKREASKSFVQRKCKLGYQRAARKLDDLADKGYLGEEDERTKIRPVLISQEEYEQLLEDFNSRLHNKGSEEE